MNPASLQSATFLHPSLVAKVNRSWGACSQGPMPQVVDTAWDIPAGVLEPANATLWLELDNDYRVPVRGSRQDLALIRNHFRLLVLIRWIESAWAKRRRRRRCKGVTALRIVACTVEGDVFPTDPSHHHLILCLHLWNGHMLCLSRLPIEDITLLYCHYTAFLSRTTIERQAMDFE
ncbi:hypothetical protein [Mollivirus kamchatka]|nr:hypothetical protein [Mollivirus kamchatka]